MLKREDRKLLRRLEFDQKADGTAIIAADRQDLEAALRILSLG